MAACKYVSAGYQVGPGEKLFSMGETCVPDRPIIVCPSEGGSMPPEWEAGCGIPQISSKDEGPISQALVPLPPEGSGGMILPPWRGGGLDVTGQDPFDPKWDQYAGGSMGGFLPGRLPGGGLPDLGAWFDDWLPDVIGGIIPRVPGTWPQPTPPTFPQGPIYPGQGRDVIVSRPMPGQVVFDACGRCFIERVFPARTVRRRGRIVMGPNGQPACMPAPRRMNALNPRALSRALRRASKFAKFAKKAVRISTRLKMKRGFRAPRKRKATCCK